jgi:glycosyltransferase involved in cell wall biosynthesis
MTPRVSIIVPCYNAGTWIEEALRSALGQSHRNCEIIAVDDGSTDDTRQHLERFRAEGVRVIVQEHRGASAARNRALSEATGSFIQYLDADDVLDTNKITNQIEALAAAGPRYVASGAWGRFTGHATAAVFTPEPVWRNMSGIEFLVVCAMEELMFPPVAWLIPRIVCDIAGRWDETLSLNDDGEYMARVVTASDGIVFCPEARACYRSGNPHSYGSTKSRPAAESELAAWDRIVEVMRTVEDSPRVHAAAATGYQHIQANYFMVFDDVASSAAQREQLFGAGQYRFQGGTLFRSAVQLLGWKHAMRLRRTKDVFRRSRPGIR